jgi:hypothetical protein
MKYLFVINTPAQYHFWKNIMLSLMKKNHQINILARDYGSTCQLLDNDNLKYNIYIKPDDLKLQRGFQLFPHVLNAYKLARSTNPDIIIGFGIVESIVSGFLRKPCIVFTDSEPVGVQNTLVKIFADAIITPTCFKINLGKKQVRINSFKELAYLHPSYFQPDPSIYDELNIKREEKYVVLRFNVFDAVHDIGRHGFSRDEQYRLVNEISKYVRVFISPEAKLLDELEKYRLPIAYNRIHHALYYANLLVTDTQTMTTEAAILGTPVIRCNSFVGPNDMGNFIELERKYDLIYSFRNTEQAIQKAIELIQRTDLKEQWAKKREKLLADKIDVTRFMVDFIEDYPASFQKYKVKSKQR